MQYPVGHRLVSASTTSPTTTVALRSHWEPAVYTMAQDWEIAQRDLPPSRAPLPTEIAQAGSRLVEENSPAAEARHQANVKRMLGQAGAAANGSPGGTASEVSIPGYVLGGKTGTANKIDPGTAEYSKTRYIASFVGFAPARDPRLLVSIVVDEPQGAIYGGEVAAPAFGEIAKFALPYLAIPPS